MTKNPPDLRTLGAPVYGKPSQRRSAIAFGVLLSLLMHGIALWLVLHHTPMIIKPVHHAGGTLVYLSPLADTPMSRPQPTTPSHHTSPKLPTTATRPKKSPRPKPDKTPENPAAITLPAQNAIAEPTPTPAATPDTSTPDDMFAYVQAARKRRADAEAQQQSPAENAPAAEDANQRANRIARENVAFSQKHAPGAERDDSGGLFQLRQVGQNHAEFLFRGWNTNFRRNWSQLIAVDQGGEVDIETAVVKKMIEIIRSKKSDDFIWESHRLGKTFTLSARPEHSRELQQFLLREFFPDYAPLARRVVER